MDNGISSAKVIIIRVLGKELINIILFFRILFVELTENYDYTLLILAFIGLGEIRGARCMGNAVLMAFNNSFLPLL